MCRGEAVQAGKLGPKPIPIDKFSKKRLIAALKEMDDPEVRLMNASGYPGWLSVSVGPCCCSGFSILTCMLALLLLWLSV